MKSTGNDTNLVNNLDEDKDKDGLLPTQLMKLICVFDPKIDIFVPDTEDTEKLSKKEVIE